MSDFADIFAHELTTVVYLAGSMVALMMFAATLIRMNRDVAEPHSELSHGL